MKTVQKYLVWDFDGTLGYRVSGGFSSALQEVMQQGVPDCLASVEELRAHLQTGLPWHTPYQLYLENRAAEQWWSALDCVFERAFVAVGVSELQAQRLAKEVRHVYTNPAHWRLFDDTIPVLGELQSQGWTHFILSNHVPELGSLITHLQLDSFIARVFNSAETGCEKPHPQAFQNVLNIVGTGATVWMIGDSMAADIKGAENIGIPAILVHQHHEGAKYSCEKLSEVTAIINHTY